MSKTIRPFVKTCRAALGLSVTLALALPSFAAIPVTWSVDTFRVKPLVYDCYHGETLDLAAALTAYGEPIDLAGKTARLYWATNETATTYWVTNATVTSSSNVTNILAATFSGAYDTGAPVTYGFIGIDGENYRASFELRFRASPGFTPSALPLPTSSIDFATTSVLNPESSPFMMKGGSGGTTAEQVTNIATHVTTTTVTKAYVESLGIEAGISAATATNIATAVVAPVSNDVVSLAHGVNTLESRTNVWNSVTNAYTKAEADGRYLRTTGKAADADKLDNHDSSYFATADGCFGGSVQIGTSYQSGITNYYKFGDIGNSTGGFRVFYKGTSFDYNTIQFECGGYGHIYGRSELKLDNSPVATSNMVVAVVDDRADRAITSAVDTAMTEILGANWRTTYGGGLAGIIAALVAALTFLKRGKFDASEIAADWSSSTTYALGANVTYRGKFYTSKVANNQGHTPTDTTYWNVSSPFSSDNTSLMCVLPYTLGASALADGGQLVDREINLVTSGETAKTLTLPARKVGKARDFIIRVTIPSTLTDVGGIALSGISAWEGDALTFEKGTADKTYIVTITEMANSAATAASDTPTLYIRVIEAEAQPTA